MIETEDIQVLRQRRYYEETAGNYDQAHASKKSEHDFALSVMIGTLDYLEIGSVLDVGSGTGRALRTIKAARPGFRALGVEPVAALREVGYYHGLGPDELSRGTARGSRSATASSTWSASSASCTTSPGPSARWRRCSASPGRRS